MKAHVRNGKQRRIERQRKWDAHTVEIKANLAAILERVKREAERAASEENRR